MTDNKTVVEDLAVWLTRARKRIACLVRGHQKTLLIQRMKLDAVTIGSLPNFRVLASKDYCARCGKDLP